MAIDGDIGEKISEILSSPEQLSQLQNLAAMLGLTGGTAEEPPAQPPPAPEPGVDPKTLAAITGMLARMGTLSRDDHGVALLMALKPLLGEQRQERVEQAAKLLKLARMLPLLRESGILGNL